MKKLCAAVALLITLLAACQNTLDEAPRSAWGTVYTIAHAEQLAAPAIWASRTELTAAWINADSAGIHQDIRSITAGQPSAPIVLPLPPRQPYDQQLRPAENGFHLLWLDLTENQAETRLYSAIITPDHTVQRGPTIISDQDTLRYTTIAQGDGGAWAIWSGGAKSEPALFARWIDPDGRPRSTQRLVEDADWPAFTVTEQGTITLYWMQASTGLLFRSTLTNGILESPESIGVRLSPAPGERLVNLNAGLDDSHTHLFWTIVDQNGHAATFTASSASDERSGADSFRSTSFGIGTVQPTPVITGFNSGLVSAVSAGSEAIQWAVPASMQADILPVVVVLGDILGVTYLHDGQITGYQALTRLEGHVLRPPSFQADRDGHLTVAWSETFVSAPARLSLTSTRR